jgi:hypothetical protein
LIVFADAAGDGVEADGDFTFEVAAGCAKNPTLDRSSFDICAREPSASAVSLLDKCSHALIIVAFLTLKSP